MPQPVANKVEQMPPPKLAATSSWIVYDLANTVYSATVTYLLMTHLDKTFSYGSSIAGTVQMIAMICAGVASPLFACLADNTGKTHVYCAVTTFLCIVAMSGFAVFADAQAPLLACFFFATVFYQAALVFYNALLPSVATERRMGLISGLGVGLGYLGTVFTLLVAVSVQKAYGLPAAFWVATAGFLVGALPMMLLVRERRPIRKQPFTWPLAGRQFGELLRTLRDLPKRRALMWFLIGNFFAVDVLNTAILFFAAFCIRSFDGAIKAGTLVLAGQTITNVVTFKMISGLAVTLSAFVCGILMGWLTDRIGARRAFGLAIASLAAALVGAAAFAGGSATLFLIVMCGFGGVGLAGIWTAGRKILIELVPRELVGRYFGLYGVTNKVSVIGCAVFGLLMDTLGPRVALASLVVPLAFALFCVGRMKKHAASAASGNDAGEAP